MGYLESWWNLKQNIELIIEIIKIILTPKTKFTTIGHALTQRFSTLVYIPYNVKESYSSKQVSLRNKIKKL